MSDEGEGEQAEGAGELEALRAELDAVDAMLLATAQRRLALVAQIGAVKARLGRPVFDRAREREVLRKARATAQTLGLEPRVGEALIHTLVEASHTVQEAHIGAQHTRSPRKITLVGGDGAMGRRFARAFIERGHAVQVVEARDDAHTRRARVQWADVVMVAVPMTVAAEVVREVAAWTRPDALLCDINSLKAEVCAALRDRAPGQAVGTHPMFGPTVQTLRRQKVVICPVHDGPDVAWLCAELRALGMELITATPEAHDRMMAAVQVLVHYGTLVMGESLRRCGVAIDESLQFTSPIYRLELAFVGRLFTQDPDLYAEIELQNPYGDAFRRVFGEVTAELEAVLKARDREGFRASFERVAAFFDPFGEEAMALSDQVIDRIVARS